MVGPQKTSLGLTLLFLAYSVVGVAISAADCGGDERLIKDGTCQKCPLCEAGFGYPDDQDCGYGKGANITCVPCPDGKYRDWKDDTFRCMTCNNCSQYNKAVAYKCRPEINAQCGECLPGFEENPMSGSFLLMPCIPCTNRSTSEVCRTWAIEEKERKLAEEKRAKDEKKAEELKEQWKKTEENLQELQEEKKRAYAQLANERTKNANLTTAVIALGVLSGVLIAILISISICCCLNRNGKSLRRADMRNRAESMDRTDNVRDPELGTVAFNGNQITSPLIGNGVIPHPRKQTEPLQKALSIRGAEPQYHLEEGDESPNVPSFPTASTDTDIEDRTQTADGSDDMIDSMSTCATPPQPFSAPNSGYYSMSGISSVGGPSQASTAVVRDTPGATAESIARNFACWDLAEVESQDGSSQTFLAAAAPLRQPSLSPIDPVFPNVQTDAPCGQQTVVKTAPCGGARPKQRPCVQESDEQAADRHRYEEALNAAGRGKVVDLTASQKSGLGLRLTPPSSHEPGIPHFHEVACELGIDYEVYKSWAKGTCLVTWMCNQDTHLRDVMRSLHNVRMIAARNYVAEIILSRAAADDSAANDAADDDDDVDNDAADEAPVRQLVHDPDGGIAEDDITEISNTPSVSESNAGSTQPNIPILVETPPPLDNVFDNADDMEGAAAPAPAQESKGDLRYPVSETSRGSQPLTPPANEIVEPFRVR